MAAEAILEEPPADEVSLDGFAMKVANDEVLRELMLQTGSLFSWSSKKVTGIVNLASIAQNSRLLTYLVELWCPQLPKAKTLFIPQARQEVGAFMPWKVSSCFAVWICMILELPC